MKQLLRKIGIVAGTVVMAGVAAPLIVPLPPLEGTVPPETLADPDGKFIRIGSVNLHYKRHGDGKRVFVLLHGFLRSLFSWQNIISPLSELGSVVAYDRPGFGLTSRPMPGDWKGLSPYGNRGQAEMLIQLLDAFEVDRAVLVGHAMGAGIAALAAQLFPRRVESLVLVDPDPPGQGRPGWQRLLMATPQMRRVGPVLLRGKVARQIEETVRCSWHEPDRVPARAYEECGKILRVDDWDRGLWEIVRAEEPPDKLVTPETIGAPTLVIAGENSAEARTAKVVRMAARIPLAHLALIPGSGQAPHEENPKAFMEAVQEFLATPLPAAVS